MGALKNLVGQKFGKLTVVERAENDKRGCARWRCRCDCNREIIATGTLLTSGRVKSCGCLRKEIGNQNFKNLAGKTFGRLHVTGLDGKRTYGGRERYFWSCVCSCGKTVSVCSEHLTRGAVCSCGCLQQENRVEQGKNRGKHYLSDSKIYTVWQSMKDRCYNPNNKRYKHYGGRGITVYEPWINDFAAFYDYVSQLEHFGEDGYTLDRIDTNGNYEPGNLQWSTKFEQARNKRNNVIVEYNNERMTLAEAAERSGVPYYILQNRRRVGDTGERLFRPIGSK